MDFTIAIRSDDDGHWVEWTKADESGSLGPYIDQDMAESVKVAKEIELRENEGHIDSV